MAKIFNEAGKGTELPVKAVGRGKEVKEANHEDAILSVPGLDMVF